VIQAWAADDQGVRSVEPGEAVQHAAAGRCMTWIDIDGEPPSKITELLAPLHIHSLAIDDMVAETNRPKVDDYGSYLYLVVHSARWDQGERPALREIDMLLGERFLVTYHEGDTRSITEAREVLPRRADLLARGPSHLLHFILDVLVDHYLPIMDDIAGQLDGLEEQVFDRPEDMLNTTILRLKRGMAALRRIVGPQRDTLLALTRDEFQTIPPPMRPYLRDVYDRLARVNDLLDSFRDEVSGVLDLHLAVVSNRLNKVIKVLTVIATLGLPLTVVTSYYGMNFHMAEYQWKHGELFVLGLLVATLLGTWGVLKLKRWL
jgi:magnesium transporter